MFENEKNSLIKTCRDISAKKLTVATWGNVSLRISENKFLITPSGMDYNSLIPEDIVLMDFEENIIEGIKKPSVEYFMHLCIYRNRKDINAVIHTHAVFSTAFALNRMPVPPVAEEMIQIIGEEIQCADYGLPGSRQLGENVAAALGNNFAVLMASHGAVCVGKDFQHALKISEVLEKTCQTIIYAKILGNPYIIPHEECEAMIDFTKNKYGQK